MTANIINKRNENRWYRLDNAAKIYPAVRNANHAVIFRVAAQLKEAVDPDILQEALTRTLPRFPSFNVRIQKGIFWYYFEHNPDSLHVTEEKAPVCRPINVTENNGYLIRVSYFNMRISLEVFHAVADGTGALAFLKALIYKYLSLQGKPVDDDDGDIDSRLYPSVREVEDSFQSYYDEKKKKGWAESRAYQIKGTSIPRDYMHLTQGIIPVQAIKSLAKDSGASVTEYLVALLIYAIYVMQLKGNGDKMPVKVSVPVNLRRFFASQTLRNFSSYINVGKTFGDGEYTFEDILKTVQDDLQKNLKKEKFIEKISANVAAERHTLMRLTPLFMKNIALKSAYNRYGERLVTSTLSNLGVVKLPESLKNYVERFDFVLGAPLLNKISCAVCSYGENLVISFTSIMEETDIERFFYRYLTRKGVDVVIETNYGVEL